MVALLNGSRDSFFNTKTHAQDRDQPLPGSGLLSSRAEDRLLMRRVLQHLKLHTQALCCKVSCCKPGDICLRLKEPTESFRQ